MTWKKATLTAAGCLFAAEGLAQSRLEIETWHNVAPQPARIGHAHPWTVVFPAKDDDTWGVASASNMVLVFSGPVVRALSSRNGKVLWVSKSPIPTSDPSDGFREAAVRSGRVLILQWGHGRDVYFVALDRRNGHVVWSSSTSLRLGNVQTVGANLACELWTKRQDKYGTRTEPELDKVEVLDARTGRVRCALSPTDRVTNRAILAKQCPEMLDQLILFGDRCTLNGVYCGPQVTFMFSPQTWIIGDSLYTHKQIEDYAEMGDLSGLCGLQKFSLSGILHSSDKVADLWRGKAMGRSLYQVPCSSFGPILGLYKGRLLTTRTIVTATEKGLSGASSLVTIPEDGEPKAVSLIHLKGGFILVPGGRLSIGYLLAVVVSTNYQLNRVALFCEGRLMLQPVPATGVALRRAVWLYHSGSMDGVIYQGGARRRDGSRVYCIHLEPFVRRRH